ncbi:MAG TPA: tetratricopeptide repeat protein [Candidatus Baltobacteraceae bacterium]|nr:tetratricopeptide repeat protein [Candidatus Baltobacteraceae bacterium]
MPRLASSLFGREDELTEVQTLMQKRRVVTLTGAGGVGKTRLAIELGYRELDVLEDGAWFVDLAALRDATAVPGAIASVFRIRESPNRALTDAIADALRHKELLLIVDNCEHLVEAAAAAIEVIATECPNVRVLATSRQPLGMAGEQTYRLASLDVAAAVALFCESAQRADASFSFGDDLSTVERICQRLDGIALAIELAAARVQVLSLAQIESLLDRRFAVLTGGRNLARHQTMRALVDWSYDLLAPEEQSFFSRLGVFSAEFSYEAAAAICSGDGIAETNVLEILGSLVHKSLLTSERHGKVRRFRLLETMRAYAVEKLGASIHELNTRHARYYFEFVTSGDSRTTEWRDVLEADYDNLRRALDWTIDENGDVPLGIRMLAAMCEFLLYRGLGPDSARRAERALDGRTPLSKPLQAMAWETITRVPDMLLPAAALEASNRALVLYDELEDFRGVARALHSRGVANLRLGDFAQAEQDLQRALDLAKEYDDPREVAQTLGSIAVSYEMMGRPEEGRHTMVEVLDMARRDGDERLINVTLINLAETEFVLGEVESSVRRVEELLANRTSRKNVRLRGYARANLSVYLLALGRADEARTAARIAIVEAREAGDAGITACAIQHMAAMLSPSDPRTAARLLGYVDGIFASGHRREGSERYTHSLLVAATREKLSDGAIKALEREGETMSELQAVRLATRFNGRA